MIGDREFEVLGNGTMDVKLSECNIAPGAVVDVQVTAETSTSDSVSILVPQFGVVEIGVSCQGGDGSPDAVSNLKLKTSHPQLPTLLNSIGMTLVQIPPGTFQMGSATWEAGANNSELLHPVTISRAFWMGTREVTQQEWDKVMDRNPSRVVGANLPVHDVKWTDVMEFCRRLSEREGVTYRLPTEAEWEYACRAGTTTAFSFGDDPEMLPYFGWHNGTVRGVPQPVGGLEPNPWGLFDIHGNVSEWCSDYWSFRYPAGAQTDPFGPPGGSERVCRGGRCDYYDHAARSGARDSKPEDSGWPSVGFRIVREASPQAGD